MPTRKKPKDLVGLLDALGGMALDNEIPPYLRKAPPQGKRKPRGRGGAMK
jgi:hypothetical protein